MTSILLFLLTIRLFAATTMNNDDSCDISLAPAATLLLPWFDVSYPDGFEKTIFTITNVTAVPQIAHVTIWTDWSFPILSFNLFLTGYDVQAVDLSDVLLRGIIAPPGGTSATDRSVSPNPSSGVPGTVPDTYVSNPNITREAVAFGGACSSQTTQLPRAFLAEVQSALTTGLYQGSGIGCGNQRVGGSHSNLNGSITIDVVNTCTTRYPDDPQYLLKELLFDNALIGDYQDVHSSMATGNLAQGNPMVHIRAIPEGGSAGSHYGSNLPYTFYDRFTVSLPGQKQRTFDRRQPLPSVFAMRWVEGETGSFNTSYKIWREGVVVGTQSCSKARLNSNMRIPEPGIVRFDERENSRGHYSGPVCTCPVPVPALPAAARISTKFPFPPNNSSIDISGWFYLNLNNYGAEGYSANGRTGSLPTPFAPAGTWTSIRPSQNWVIVSMSALGRYSVDFDAAMLGNGCTPAAILGSRIGPAANVNPSGHVD